MTPPNRTSWIAPLLSELSGALGDAGLPESSRAVRKALATFLSEDQAGDPTEAANRTEGRVILFPLARRLG